MSTWKAKRFWSEVSAEQVDGGWRVTLDGRQVRTPQKAALVVPTEALATMIADEWFAQEDEVRPDTMPATRMANSAIDKVAPQRAGVVEVVCAYGETDLLCYRAESPASLVAQQAEAWDEVLDWAADTLGARLRVTTGVVPVAQDAEAIARLRGELDALDPFALAAMHDLVSLTGSLVLGLAVGRGVVGAEQAWAKGRVDEEWQISQWGRDEEADDLAARKRGDFMLAESFFQAAKPRF